MAKVSAASAIRLLARVHLRQALPEESFDLVAADFRREQAGCEDKTVDKLHADGSYIRSVCTLYGASTIYRAQGVEHSVPRGQTLLLTAMDRAKALGLPCTLHRRPGPGPERAGDRVLVRAASRRNWCQFFLIKRSDTN